ncbi:MAG: hypothetical protein QOE68_4392 [Thermoanaerobaculia bacterium]|nr:hypothetical protein [Thermoanaerobaculia bacterium]
MKRLVLVFVCATLSLMSVAASAQKPSLPSEAPAARVSGEFMKAHDSTNAKFEEIQSLLSGIEREKVIHEGDTQKLDKLMFDYAKQLKAAFDQATRDADEAAKSKGQRGSAQSAVTFESLALQHEKASRSWEPRLNQIQSKLATAEIKPDVAALKNLSAAGLQEYRKSLTPAGLKEMERVHPELMKASSHSRLGTPDPRLVAQGIAVPLSDQIDRAVSQFIDEVGPDSAGASLAAPCVSSCSQKNWGACAACILSKTPAAIAAWNTFTSCWNSIGTCDWRHWQNCARKAACLATLISKLA